MKVMTKCSLLLIFFLAFQGYLSNLEWTSAQSYSTERCWRDRWRWM